MLSIRLSFGIVMLKEFVFEGGFLLQFELKIGSLRRKLLNLNFQTGPVSFNYV